MPENVIVTIDGKTVEVAPGTLIVEAAKQTGIIIPTFCYDERMRSVGACRMCLVEVEKSPKLVASCATPVAPNMVVHTDTEKVIRARKGVLEFLLINHPLDCPTCDKGGECPLQDLTYDHGPAESRYRENKIRFMADINQKFDDTALGPQIMLCRNRCIMCFKCIRIVRELAGEADLGVFRRGAFARINVLDEVAFADEFSGNTVEYCPVGALTSRSFRYKIRDWLLKKTPSVCNLCSDGCNMSVEWSQARVYRHMSRRNPVVDDGWLCDRGRYSFDITTSEERIVKPLIRRDGGLAPCSWSEATILAAKHLRKIIDSNRGKEVAAVGSPALSNEEAYAIRRFFADVVKTSEIDFQADTNQPLEPELVDLMGLNGSIAELEHDSLFLFVGCDPAVEHPILTLRIKKAISRKGAKAVFLGSYDKRLGNFLVTNARVPYARESLALEHVCSILSGRAMPSIEGVPLNEDKLTHLAELLKGEARIHIIAGDGFLLHPNRAVLLASLVRLKKLVKARFSILPSQANFIGVSHFGLYGNSEHSFSRVLSRIEAGDVKSLFVFGSDPVGEFPDRKHVQDVLKKLEFLVVVAPFMNSTASLAGAVFPQALLPDYGGTFVNIEGRIQQFWPTEEIPVTDARPVWAILSELSDIMELGPVWYHDSQVRQDMAKNLKGTESFVNIPKEGLLLPFLSTDEIEPVNASSFSELKPPLEFPYALQWANSVHHGSRLTERSRNLMSISGKQVLLMHPGDAAQEGISDGQVVRIGSDAGALNVAIEVSKRVNRGELLLINSFSDNPVNRLMRQDRNTIFVAVSRGSYEGKV